MKLVVCSVLIVIYFAAISYLLLCVLGFTFGVRIAGNLFAEEGLALQRTTALVLLVALAGAGFCSVWWIKRRSV